MPKIDYDGNAEWRLRQQIEEVRKFVEDGTVPREPTDEQRADWAFGNAAISNPNVTREMAENAAKTTTVLTGFAFVPVSERTEEERAIGGAVWECVECGRRTVLLLPDARPGICTACIDRNAST